MTRKCPYHPGVLMREVNGEDGTKWVCSIPGCPYNRRPVPWAESESEDD